MKSHTILVIEDEHDIRVTLRDALEAEGYQVLSATNGGSALEILRKIEAPSLILLDIQMPLVSGSEFLSIRARDPDLAQVPVFLLTAALPSKLPMLDTVNRILRKPINLPILLSAIRTVVASDTGADAWQPQVMSC